VGKNVVGKKWAWKREKVISRSDMLTGALQSSHDSERNSPEMGTAMLTDTGINPWELKHTHAHTLLLRVLKRCFSAVFTQAKRGGMETVPTGLYPTVQISTSFHSTSWPFYTKPEPMLTYLAY